MRKVIQADEVILYEQKKMTFSSITPILQEIVGWFFEKVIQVANTIMQALFSQGFIGMAYSVQLDKK